MKVGTSVRVIGVDMTPEQLSVATSFQDYHADAFNSTSGRQGGVLLFLFFSPLASLLIQ